MIACHAGSMDPQPPNSGVANSNAPMNALSPTTDSADKSKCPVSMVKDWPITKMPTAATLGIMFNSVLGVKKLSDSKEKAMIAIKHRSQTILSRSEKMMRFKTPFCMDLYLSLKTIFV